MKKFETISFSNLDKINDGKHMILMAIDLDEYEKLNNVDILQKEINEWIQDSPEFFEAGKDEEIISIKRVVNDSYNVTNAVIEFKKSMMKPLARLNTPDWKWIEDFVANAPTF